MSSLRVLSWNILQGGGKRADRIAEAIVVCEPDIAILQEYRNGNSASVILSGLEQIGLVHRHIPKATARKNCVLIASRYPIKISQWNDVLDPALAMTATIDIDKFQLHIHAAHLPHKKPQIPYLEALLDMPIADNRNSIIIGDLNCGIPFEDSETKTFDNTYLFQQLMKQGWVDTWRSRNLAVKEFSWVSNRGNGYRYDHCLCTTNIDQSIANIAYDHGVRELGISDHSAMILNLNKLALIS
ncbi:MAG: endonuclease/exonuclease/phosphatase family protein [Granulosicoccus sp.]